MSYDPTLATDRDKVRFNTGDTLDSEILVDDTIDALLAELTFVGAVRAAARAMIAILSKKPEEVSESGGVSFKWRDRLDDLRKLADGKTPVTFGAETGSAPLSGQLDLRGGDSFR